MTHRKNQTCGQNVICVFSEDGGRAVSDVLLFALHGEPGQRICAASEASSTCDLHLFVPKFKVLDAQNNLVYMIRPNTCFGGCCVRCKCDGVKGKCFRVPFYV